MSDERTGYTGSVYYDDDDDDLYDSGPEATDHSTAEAVADAPDPDERNLPVTYTWDDLRRIFDRNAEEIPAPEASSEWANDEDDVWDIPLNYEDGDDEPGFWDDPTSWDNRSVNFEIRNPILTAMVEEVSADSPTTGYGRMRDMLGYPRATSEEAVQDTLKTLRTHPQRDGAGELTNERLTELALLQADAMDAEGKVQLERSIASNDGSGWPVYAAIIDADDLRERALAAYHAGDRSYLNELNSRHGLDIHNITDEAAARGATHWNNDPPETDTKPWDAGIYVQHRLEAWEKLHSSESPNGALPESRLREFANLMFEPYRVETNDPAALLRMNDSAETLYRAVSFTHLDDGTIEDLSIAILEAARTRDAIRAG